ncbi:hypothetical protein I317_06861 [Kwoniella heveanensis CBS 569]|uniref:Cytochrome b5 heme-binding domain-containing protein n=1 Tax=Kwoniella heveanensis BCC8398 TaxID=1296120 RepID=A0A1B9H1Z4_9TREE|nr:hypothetical protein I316_01202 [Kwoniella heveanensis BCC8398]OCF39326.1 hypothetical protein I317_06861 [Kwoniella heveanensis CBS 569]
MSWLIPSIPSWSRSTPSSSSTSTESGVSPNGQQHEKLHNSFNGGEAEEGEEEGEEDIDAPPPFPLPDSYQRSKASASSSSSSHQAPVSASTQAPTPSFSLAPPSPTKSATGADDDDGGRPPPSELNIAIVDSPLGNMAPPPSTTKKPTFGLQVGGDQSGHPMPALTPSPTTTTTSKSSPSAPAAPVAAVAGSSRTALGLAPAPKSKLGVNRSKAGDSSPPVMKGKKGKVALTPGHSALDWARLTCSGEDLRGVQGFQRVTLAELKEHNTPDDAWSVFNGMVYNITPYIPFHPGGEKELMRVAGRDGTKLFSE